MNALALALRHLGLALVDPAAAQRSALDRPRPIPLACVLITILAALGLATLPRQIAVLDAALAPTGDHLVDVQSGIMRSGLLRLIVADRLVPLPALLVGCLLFAYSIKHLVALPDTEARVVWSVTLLGLAPLLVQRLGELAISWVLPVPGSPPAVLALNLPHRFVTGPSLAWGGDAPTWVQVLDPRINLVVLWVVGVWSAGARVLARHARFELWHLLAPFLCAVAGGLATWVLGPLAVTAILGAP